MADNSYQEDKSLYRLQRDAMGHGCLDLCVPGLNWIYSVQSKEEVTRIWKQA